MFSRRPQRGIEWVPGRLQRVVRNYWITANFYLCNEVSRFTRRKYNLNRKKHRLHRSILQQQCIVYLGLFTHAIAFIKIFTFVCTSAYLAGWTSWIWGKQCFYRGVTEISLVPGPFQGSGYSPSSPEVCLGGKGGYSTPSLPLHGILRDMVNKWVVRTLLESSLVKMNNDACLIWASWFSVYFPWMGKLG